MHYRLEPHATIHAYLPRRLDAGAYAPAEPRPQVSGTWPHTHAEIEPAPAVHDVRRQHDNPASAFVEAFLV